jgi:hypothetical protein
VTQFEKNIVKVEVFDRKWRPSKYKLDDSLI